MAVAPTTGMDRAEMKALLGKATSDKPINFAFGLGKDPNLAMLKLDKTKNPKAVDKLLSDQFSDLKASRWGTVTFDEAADTLKFLVNKPISNAARKLVKTLKGTGFGKVQIVLEDGSVVEEAGAEEEEAGAHQDPARPVAADGPSQKEAAQAAAPDRAALMADLAALIHAVPAAVAFDPSRKDALGKLAAAAGAAMKSDLAAAPRAIEALREALGAQPNGQAVPGAPPAPAGDDRTKAASALRELMMRIPSAVAARPDSKAELAALAGAANTQLKAGDLEAAAATMAKLQAALAPDGAGERLDDLAAQASVLPEPGRTTLLEQVKQVRAKPEAATLDALERAIADAAKAARLAQAQQQAGNTVAYRLLQRKWIEAEAEAQKGLGAFLDALLGDEELQADKRFAQLQAEANSFAALIPDDGGKLIAALGQLDDAGEAERPKALREAIAAVDAYRRDLDAASELEALQGVADQCYGGEKFFSALRASLTGLASELSKRG